MHTSTATTPTARLALVTAVVASLLFVTFLTVSTSRAAFSDTTSTSASTLASGDVVLTDNDAGSALFNVTGLAPTASAIECIVVTYNGSIIPTNPVGLYIEGAPTGTGLDTYLDLVVEVGTGGTFGDCTGFNPGPTISTGSTLSQFATASTAWATAVDTTWTPAAQGETRTFRFSLTLQDNNLAQDLDTGFGFTWEAQS